MHAFNPILPAVLISCQKLLELCPTPSIGLNYHKEV